MNNRIDSGQIASAVGSAASFALLNFDRVAAGLCAVVGIAYTLWKWRREARSKTRGPFRD